MPYSMTQVMLTKTFTYTDLNGNIVQVYVNFGTPAIDTDTDPGDPPSYYCPIQLDGFGDNQIYVAFGEDAVDAFMLATSLAPTLLETSWLGNQIIPGSDANYGIYPLATLPQGPFVSGTVQLELCNDPAQNITFEFRPADGSASTVIHQILTPVSADTGSFAIPGVPNGTYDLAIKGFCWLRKVIPGVVVNGADVSGLSVSLLGGDINNDNFVDTSDFGELFGDYGQQGDP